MKKLMFAAVVAAMAMGAQADRYRLECYANAYFTVSKDDSASYNKAYFVNRSVLTGWDGTVGGIDKLDVLFSGSDTWWGGTYWQISADMTKYATPAGWSEFNGIVKSSTALVAIVASTEQNKAFVMDCDKFSVFSRPGIFDDMEYDACLGFSNKNSPYDPTAVPEPTSALLMLLGMAGLALKRKVA